MQDLKTDNILLKVKDITTVRAPYTWPAQSAAGLPIDYVESQPIGVDVDDEHGSFEVDVEIADLGVCESNSAKVVNVPTHDTTVQRAGRTRPATTSPNWSNQCRFVPPKSF